MRRVLSWLAVRLIFFLLLAAASLALLGCIQALQTGSAVISALLGVATLLALGGAGLVGLAIAHPAGEDG